MIRQLRPALVMFILLVFITGGIYPMVVTGIAQAAFPHAANGSLLVRKSTLIGSALIGQAFSDPRYFQGRPSMTAGSPYSALDLQGLSGSAASNLGPLSQNLVDSVRERAEQLRAADPANQPLIPADLVTASASGLDPHISVAAARYQVPRVAAARGLSEPAVQALVDQYTEGRLFGFLGEPRVNVLLLNLALDGIK